MYTQALLMSRIHPSLTGNKLGYDCDKKIILKDDDVEVVTVDPLRNDFVRYEFCGKGKRGKARSAYSQGKEGWIILVEFSNGKGGTETIGCTDCHLRRV